VTCPTTTRTAIQRNLDEKKGSDEEEEKKSIRIGIKEKMRPEK
jgi:hypothetical protein